MPGNYCIMFPILSRTKNNSSAGAKYTWCALYSIHTLLLARKTRFFGWRGVCFFCRQLMYCAVPVYSTRTVAESSRTL